MRWLDVPAQPAHRTVADWRRAMVGRVCAGQLDRLVERAARRSPDDPPLVALASTALRAAWEHVAGSGCERGGLLVGEPFACAAGDAKPALVFVRAAVPALDDESTGYSLRMNAGVWDAARAALAPGEVVVGWFHSHPGIGAFFSGTDRRTQAGFFAHPFSVGWVVDPVRREQAWFVGPGSLALAPEDAVPLDDRGAVAA
jgi:proteasome lid subunit RPN8/RPN11